MPSAEILPASAGRRAASPGSIRGSRRPHQSFGPRSTPSGPQSMAQRAAEWAPSRKISPPGRPWFGGAGSFFLTDRGGAPSLHGETTSTAETYDMFPDGPMSGRRHRTREPRRNAVEMGRVYRQARGQAGVEGLFGNQGDEPAPSAADAEAHAHAARRPTSPRASTIPNVVSVMENIGRQGRRLLTW